MKKELAEHPDNGYALVWIASVDIRKEDYGSALSNAIKAVKYIPKKDKEYRSFALLARAEIYNRLGQRDKALEDLNLAIKRILIIMIIIRLVPNNFTRIEIMN